MTRANRESAAAYRVVGRLVAESCCGDGKVRTLKVRCTERMGRPLALTCRVLSQCLLALCLALHAASPGVGLASAAEPQIGEVAIGYQGVFKVGHWTPVWVTLTGGSASQTVTLEIQTPDTDGVPTQFLDEASAEVRLEPGRTLKLLRYFKPGQTAGEVVVRVRQGRGVVAERRLTPGRFATPLSADQPLIVTYGGPVPVAEALALGGRLSGAAGPTPRLDSAEQLPDEWLGYEGVNVLVLSTSRPEPLDSLTERQRMAIRQWVRMGGRLVFCVGSRGSAVLDPQGAWADLAPGRFGSVAPVRSGSALETYTGAAEPLNLAAFGPAALRLTRLHDVRGKVELSDTATDGLRPIIVRCAYGFGLVMFVAYDLDTPPLSDWEGTPRLVAKVLERLLDAAPHGATEQRSGRVVHEGFRDLVGQLRTALDEFPGVTMVAFSWIAGLVLLYIVLIGPGDYFLLTRWLDRAQWTWITFPLLVLAFAGLAGWLNFRLKDDRQQVNQADIVDFDAQSGALRGTSWFHVYSPATRTWDFEIDTDGGPLAGKRAADALSWQGLPGAGLGGMSSHTAATTFQEPYAIVRRANGRTTIRQMPIAVRSTRSLVGRWWGTSDFSGTADLQMTADGLLSGTVGNPLPVELTDCSLLFENWVYRLENVRGVLRPGESTRIDREHPFNLQWRLMRRRVQDTNQAITPWDSASTDVPRILEMMMFHEAAGATGYTQLTHQYQGFVDLSDHVTSGCAVLVGRCSVPLVRLVTPGVERAEQASQAWTFVRIVWPVRPNSSRSPLSEDSS